MGWVSGGVWGESLCHTFQATLQDWPPEQVVPLIGEVTWKCAVNRQLSEYGRGRIAYSEFTKGGNSKSGKGSDDGGRTHG